MCYRIGFFRKRWKNVVGERISIRGEIIFRTMEQFLKISKTPFVQPVDRKERVESLLQKLDGEEKQLVTDLVNENKKLLGIVDYVRHFEYLASELKRYHKETKDRERKHVFLHALFMHTIAMSDNPGEIEAVKEYRAGMKHYFSDFEPTYVTRFNINNPETWKCFQEKIPSWFRQEKQKYS